MFQIKDFLFLGDITSSQGLNDLRRVKIKCILSLCNDVITKEYAELLENEGIVRVCVSLTDEEDEVLLKCLESCTEFIEKGRRAGNVLVHCFAGVSRSAAIVIAYLMKTESWSYEFALDYVIGRKSNICPNAGFAWQLQLFGQMGFTLDNTNVICQRLLFLARLSERKGGMKISKDVFLKKEDYVRSGSFTITCRKCRFVLCKDNNIWHGVQGIKIACPNLYLVAPLEWKDVELDLNLHDEEKLYCPKCRSKIGNYSFLCVNCTCGEMQCPSLRIVSSKVDLKPS